MFLKLHWAFILKYSWSQILFKFKSFVIFQIWVFSNASYYGRTHRIWKAWSKVSWRWKHLVVYRTWLCHKWWLSSVFISCLSHLWNLRFHWNRSIVKLFFTQIVRVFKSHKLLLLKVCNLKRIIFLILIVIEERRLWNLALQSFMLALQKIWRFLSDIIFISVRSLLCSWSWSRLHAVL